MCDATSSANSTDDVFTDGQNAVLSYGIMASSGMSILGSGFIIFTYLRFPKLRTMAYRLVFMLSISDFFYAGTYFFAGAYTGAVEVEETCEATLACKAEAVLLQVTATATLFWTCALAFHVYGVLVKKWSRHHVESLEKYYHVVCWGMAIVSGVALVASGVAGSAENWCWISADENPLYRLLFWYGWLFATLFGNTFVYWRVSLALNEFATAEVKDKIVGRLRLYVLVFIVVHTFAVINRLQNYIAPDEPVFVLTALQSLIEPQQGWWNAVVYGLNQKVMKEYKRSCFRKRDRSPGGLEMEEDFDVVQQQQHYR